MNRGFKCHTLSRYSVLAHTDLGLQELSAPWQGGSVLVIGTFSATETLIEENMSLCIGGHLVRDI